MLDILITSSRAHYPDFQALYLFGSQADASAGPHSDVDLALLLPPQQAKQAGSLAMSELRFDLEQRLGKHLDLINLRQVSTVLQKEVVVNGRRIAAPAFNAAETFEMLVYSLYQKLNEERRAILAEFQRSGRAYAV